MATLKDLEKYLNHEFSSFSDTGQDYKSFQTKYINYIKSFCTQNYWQLIKINRNHYCFSAFIKNNEGHYVYISISDVRHFNKDWYNHILIRTAESERDYRGGRNLYTELPILHLAIKNLFNKCF